MLWSTLTGKLERTEALDPATHALERAVQAVLPPSRFKDLLHGTWLGHQLHPILIALPIGMWTGASLLDLTAGEDGRKGAQRLVAAGALLVAPTAATGLAAWSDLGEFERPKRVGLVHAASNAVTTAVYVASWMARRRGDHERGRDLALLGSLGLVVGGYLGGHLSYSQGVGVNRNADEPKEPRAWTDAAAAADVGDRPLRVEVEGQQIVLVRTPDGVAALGAVCSHYGAPLEQGEVVDGCLECPWHGSRFRLSDGAVKRGPAVSPQLSYDVRQQGDRLQVRVRP